MLGYTPLEADTPWSRHPPEQTSPGADTPREQTAALGADTPQSRHTPPEQTPLEHPPGADTSPGADTPPGSRPPPPREADSSIRSTSGRYASYWNALLFIFQTHPTYAFEQTLYLQPGLYASILITQWMQLSWGPCT